jgi:hypothetical protein
VVKIIVELCHSEHLEVQGSVSFDPVNHTVQNFIVLKECRGTRWRSCLRHCATSLKVAGSVPDGVIGIYH